jgi:hypothetical protein
MSAGVAKMGRVATGKSAPQASRYLAPDRGLYYGPLSIIMRFHDPARNCDTLIADVNARPGD